MKLCKLTLRPRARHRLILRLKLGGGVLGSVHVATPGSVHGTFFELQLLRLKLSVRLMLRLKLRFRLRLRLRLRLWLGGGRGAVLVDMPDSVHSTCSD